MADLGKELDELHAEVVRLVREKVSTNGDSDDLRLALALLKQNNVTANLNGITDQALKQRMMGKLDFSDVQRRVIPLHAPTAEPPPRKSAPGA